jgi:hypothetical protein
MPDPLTGRVGVEAFSGGPIPDVNAPTYPRARKKFEMVVLNSGFLEISL